jgi:hypothetical protein
MSFVRRRYVSYYRMALPLSMQKAKVHEGKWTALLSLSTRSLQQLVRDAEKDPQLLRALRTKSVPYNLLVHAYSTLRMSAGLERGVVGPGERVEVTATLSESGVPVTTRAALWMEVQSPTANVASAQLRVDADGVFRGSFATHAPGVYQIRVRARGSSLAGKPFSREKVLSAAAVAKGGTLVDPGFEAEQAARDERLCRLLECILGNAKLETIGLDTQLVRKCIAEYCRKPKRLPSERVPRKPTIRPKPAGAVAPLAPAVAPPPPTVAKLEEAKPRIREKMDMEHAMEGPMFGLSPQDIAEARARGVKGEPPGPARIKPRDDSETGKSKGSKKPRPKK